MSEITRNPLCWPNNVPRTAPHLRGQPLFNDVTIETGTSHITQEINRLNKRQCYTDDRSVIISSNLNIRKDGLPFSQQAQPSDPGIAVYFKLRFVRNGKWYERPCVLTCDKWNRVGFNLEAIARDISAQRARERWGCTSIEQAFQGYLAIPERCGGLAWWDLLGVHSAATQEQIKERFKALAKTSHPDAGGNRDEWDRLQNAYDQALAHFR